MPCSGRLDKLALRVVTLATLVGCAAPWAAHAKNHRHLPLSFATAADAEHAQNHPECTCRAAGESHPLGTQVCLSGGQLFRCAMDQNVTSWQPVGAPCPQS